MAIAAKLLVIKSKAILPTLEVETEDEDEKEEDLTEKLLLYKQFKEVGRYIKKLDQQGNQSFTRTLVFSQRVHFWPDPNIYADTLLNSIQNVVQSLKELDNLPKAKVKEAVSIQEKIAHLQIHLSRQIETKLSDLLSTSKNRSEVIITFLALLELIKQRMFRVDQDALFSDITIKKYEQTIIETEEVMVGTETLTFETPSIAATPEDEEFDDEDDDED